VAGAGLLIKSFVALQDVSLGFQTDRVLVVETSVPASDLESARRATRFYKELLPRLRAVPGVLDAGAIGIAPGNTVSDGGYYIDRCPQHLASPRRTQYFPSSLRTLLRPPEFHCEAGETSTTAIRTMRLSSQ